MKIGMTYDLKGDWVKAESDPEDINAELDKPETVDRIAAALESAGHQVRRIGNVFRLLEQIDSLDVDIVFNIAEGRFGRNRESQVPLILEMKGIPCIGADALCMGMTLDKVMAKKAFIADGIPTPKFFCADKNDDLKKLNKIGFPLIVKTRHEGTSKGLTDKSVVKDYVSLKKQVAIINDRYHQTALVEQFIKGTEFTVPILGTQAPEAMPVLQVTIDGDVNLGSKFFTFEMVTYHGLQYECPAKISRSLTKRLQDLAVRAYKSVDCRDFGRVDFRLDEKGNPYVLEINPLPSLAGNDAFNIFPQVMGTTYNATIIRILDLALERNGMLKRKNNTVRARYVEQLQRAL